MMLWSSDTFGRYVSPKRRYTFTKLKNVTSRENTVFILTAVLTCNVFSQFMPDSNCALWESALFQTAREI